MTTKSAVVYLVRSTLVDVRDVVNSLKSMYAYFLNRFQYPVILLIEQSFKEEWRTFIQNNVDSRIILSFEHIQFPTPASTSVPRVLTIDGQPWPIGYRQMCRFWSGGFLTFPALQPYDYIWRMDTDAFLTKPIDIDFFQYMQDNNITYGYSNTTQDDASVCVGLDEASNTFFKSIGRSYHWERYKMYTTHVEIMHIPTMKQSEYYDYFTALDNHAYDGFYMRRWGDAPIRYIAFNNLRDLRTWHLGIAYFHGNDGSARREQLLNER